METVYSLGLGIMDKELYIQECYRQLISHFALVKKQKVDEAMQHRIQGFINAGEFLGLFSRDEAIKVIDDAHFKIFGITKEQRKARNSQIKSARGDDDYSIFDTPAIDRIKLEG